MIPFREQTTPAGDDRPDWARRFHLPAGDQLRYVNTLTLTFIGAVIAVYLIARVTERGPGALVKAVRQRVGV